MNLSDWLSTKKVPKKRHLNEMVRIGMAKQKQPKGRLFLSATSMKTLLREGWKARNEIRFQSEARPQEDERSEVWLAEHKKSA